MKKLFSGVSRSVFAGRFDARKLKVKSVKCGEQVGVFWLVWV